MILGLLGFFPSQRERNSVKALPVERRETKSYLPDLQRKTTTEA
jgi:hypothetical protein